MKTEKPTIGLFGTCGKSTWRNEFITIYNSQGIEYFNPLKDDWKPEDAADEARHLAEDEIILFPITNETYAYGSLAEIGFSILQAIRLDDKRDFVVLIDNDVDETLKENASMAKESVRSRALVKQHLKKLRLSNLYMVDTLEEMLTVSILLYPGAKARRELRKYNPHNRM